MKVAVLMGGKSFESARCRWPPARWCARRWKRPAKVVPRHQRRSVPRCAASGPDVVDNARTASTARTAPSKACWSSSASVRGLAGERPPSRLNKGRPALVAGEVPRPDRRGGLRVLGPRASTWRAMLSWAWGGHGARYGGRPRHRRVSGLA